MPRLNHAPSKKEDPTKRSEKPTLPRTTDHGPHRMNWTGSDWTTSAAVLSPLPVHREKTPLQVVQEMDVEVAANLLSVARCVFCVTGQKPRGAGEPAGLGNGETVTLGVWG